MHSKLKQKGFTLIELMIVISIIAILVAIAFPRYQDFLIKSQIVTVISETASLKSTVGLCVNEGRLIVGVRASDNFTVTCEPNISVSNLMHTGDTSQIGNIAINGGYVQVTILGDGTVSMASRFGSSAHTKLSSVGIVWFRHLNGDWTCKMGIVEPGVVGQTLANVTPMSADLLRYVQPNCPAVI